MATRRASSKAHVLVGTDIPGVYINRSGVHCDANGVSIAFTELKSKDEARWVEAVGAAPRTPAELLKAVAFDPRMRLDVRLHAARQAAPYFDMKMPLRVEGSLSAKSALDLSKLASMPKTKREQLLTLLKEMGVEL